MTPYIEKVQGMFLFLLTTAENHDPSKSVILIKLFSGNFLIVVTK